MPFLLRMKKYPIKSCIYEIMFLQILGFKCPVISIIYESVHMYVYTHTHMRCVCVRKKIKSRQVHIQNLAQIFRKFSLKLRGNRTEMRNLWKSECKKEFNGYCEKNRGKENLRSRSKMQKLSYINTSAKMQPIG